MFSCRIQIHRASVDYSDESVTEGYFGTTFCSAELISALQNELASREPFLPRKLIFSNF